MISPDFCKTMARYNRWQNTSLVSAAESLDDAARRVDRGAFFGSIFATLNHVLWGDAIWMSRFDGWPPPVGDMADSTSFHSDWAAYKSARTGADARISDWAGAVTADTLHAELSWQSGGTGHRHAMPRWFCIQHFFNHQTHHRGQVHAMLTAAGARPDATDVFLMPDTE